jgi:hypothetical protein
MVLNKQELIGLLQHEVNVLLHLAGKADQAQLDYRPTPGQRSTREWLQYLSIMGPILIQASTQSGTFDPAAWTAADTASKSRSIDETLAVIRGLSDVYAREIGKLSDADFRREVNMFGTPQSIGAFLVSVVLASHVAYRTQIFCYLKSCGRAELNTNNLWRGVDAPMGAAT